MRKARGLARILGEAWDRPAVVPDAEIEAVRQVAASRVPALPYPYLREGRRVRIVSGPWWTWRGLLAALVAATLPAGAATAQHRFEMSGSVAKPRDRYRYFASTEHPDPALRPVLRVSYVAETSPSTATSTAP